MEKYHHDQLALRWWGAILAIPFLPLYLFVLFLAWLFDKRKTPP
jgi:hypothetical protein